MGEAGGEWGETEEREEGMRETGGRGGMGGAGGEWGETEEGEEGMGETGGEWGKQRRERREWG
jgi:hypothetical protein